MNVAISSSDLRFAGERPKNELATGEISVDISDHKIKGIRVRNDWNRGLGWGAFA